MSETSSGLCRLACPPAFLLMNQAATEAELLAIAADELCEYRGGYGDEHGDFLEFELPPASVGLIRRNAAREILRRLGAGHEAR